MVTECQYGALMLVHRIIWHIMVKRAIFQILIQLKGFWSKVWFSASLKKKCATTKLLTKHSECHFAAALHFKIIICIIHIWETRNRENAALFLFEFHYNATVTVNSQEENHQGNAVD